MSDSPFPSDEGGTPSSFRPISFWRLAYKELRETLRDRRTLLTLFLMPLIVYPILSLLLQSFFLSGLPTTAAEDNEDPDRLGANEFAYVLEEQQTLNEEDLRKLNRAFVDYNAARERSGTNESNPGNLSAEDLATQKNLFEKHSFNWVDPEQEQDIQEMLANGSADVGVLVDNRRDADGKNTGLQFTLLYLDNDVRSLKALALLENILNYTNLSTYQTLLERVTGRRLIREPVSIKTEMIELKSNAAGSTGISFAAIIPLILTLMTITGAVYPAIDLTAGERERGTLESMIAAPIPRMRILLGKLVAIISVAMLTAIVNLLGMSITLWVFQLDTVFLGEQGLSVATAIRVLGLLILFAAFFSSVLLVITSFARSFKEGQAYLIPVVMVALAPSLMSLKPDLQLTGVWTVTPLVNIVLLARDVIDGSADWRNAIITVLSTAMYSLLALTLAARFFGTASVLYGQGQGIGNLFKRPHRQQKYASLSLGMLCLACLFPATFIWNGVLARTAVVETSGSEIADAAAQQSLLAMQLWLAAAGLVIVFLLIPWAITAFHRVRFRSGFGISKTSAVALIAGVMMGIGFGPLLLQVISWSSQALDFVGLSDEATSDLLVQRGEQYVERIKQAPIWMLLLSMAIVPAICEELFFRGLLFRSFRTHFSPWKTIFATAILFGSFHLISSSGLTISRFLPTTIMGVILGWVCYRSGSVIPGILLHALHNAITVCFAYYRDDLIELGRITAEQENVPPQVLVVGAICATAGVLLLRFFSKPPEMDESSSDVVFSG
ncbi:MAG: CPBP family intramembrane metalloprotease [Planctomycetaceae bacterium]|nr:CPBP family intramembrane metalloprotease [Planctomycetaceae bacterium]MCP4461418.1 CPBP family intramembrane metalloprotease [Planctomycetaceae bacterium]